MERGRNRPAAAFFSQPPQGTQAPRGLSSSRQPLEELDELHALAPSRKDRAFRQWKDQRRRRKEVEEKEQRHSFSSGRERGKSNRSLRSFTTCPASASSLPFLRVQLVRGQEQAQRAAQKGESRAKKQGERAERARENGSRQALSRSLFDRRTRGGGGATIKKQLRSSKQERGGLAQLHSPAGARAGLGAEEAGEACLLVEGAGEERHGGDRWWF